MVDKIISIIDELKEIEEITEINGCFLLQVKDYKVVESTIPLKIHDQILWEIPVLKDTFQQFSFGVEHGHLNEIMLEGDRGYFFIYSLTPEYILLALSNVDINLSYLKIAMFDLVDRISKKLGFEVRQTPDEQIDLGIFIGMDVAVASGKEPEIGVDASEIPTSKITEVFTPEIQGDVMLKVEETPVPEPVTVDDPELALTNISELLKSLDSSSTSLKSKIIRKLFVILKHNLAKITGNELSNYLEDIKENILSFIGGSLALFDMSRNARTYKKIKTPLSEDLVAEVSDKIDNWVIRLAKD